MIREEQNEIALDAIILAYGTLHYADISIDKTFELSIKHLLIR